MADKAAEAAGPAAASAPAPAAAAGTTAAAADEENWKERRKERTLQLKTIREQEKKKLKTTHSENAKERLAYLMKQADIFSHFIGGSRPDEVKGEGGSSSADTAAAAAAATAAAASSSSSGTGRRGKGRLSEKAEDEMLMAAAGKDEGAKAAEQGTRLTVQPKCIAFGKMRDYQLEGLNWLIKLFDNGINGILADEMGLGKTLQTISLLGYLKESRAISGPHLVITPKSTLTNWANECARWCPSLKVIKFHGDKATRAKIRADNFDVEGASPPPPQLPHGAILLYACHAPAAAAAGGGGGCCCSFRRRDFFGCSLRSARAPPRLLAAACPLRLPPPRLPSRIGSRRVVCSRGTHHRTHHRTHHCTTT